MNSSGFNFFGNFGMVFEAEASQQHISISTPEFVFHPEFYHSPMFTTVTTVSSPTLMPEHFMLQDCTTSSSTSSLSVIDSNGNISPTFVPFEFATTEDQRSGSNSPIACDDLEYVDVPGDFVGTSDIATLIHHHLFGNYVERPTWIRRKLNLPLKKITLVRIECHDYCLRNESGVLQQLTNIFKRRSIPLKPDVTYRSRFWHALTTISLSSLRNNIASKGDLLVSGHEGERSKFLVTLEEMCQHAFPLKSEAHFAFCNTKRRYHKLNDTSPLFAIDCEMCITTIGKLELTRVSMLNEKGDIVLDTLVKPYNKIIDYCTEFSGITEEVMRDVHTRLGDVQKSIRELLPNDAILCGHSIETDLRQLRLKHPYCIDTSLQYNLSGSFKQRPSLRKLSAVFLNRDIQSAKSGHCSIEDCAATLDLVKMKLREGLAFGNLLRGWDGLEWRSANKISSEEELQKTKETGKVCCTDCGMLLRIKCPASDNCLCRTRPDVRYHCVKCQADAFYKEHLMASTVTNSSSALNSDVGDMFDFDEVLCAEHFPENANIAECMTFTDKNLLLRVAEPSEFVPEGVKQCHLYDTNRVISDCKFPPLYGIYDMTLAEVSAINRSDAAAFVVETAGHAFHTAPSETLVLVALTAQNGVLFAAIA